MMAAWQEQVEEDWEVLSIVNAVRLRTCQALTSALQQEWVRWHQKEAVMAAQRAQKEREARVLLKRLGTRLRFESLGATAHSLKIPRIQAVNAAKGHLADILPNAVEDLKEVAFPDSRGLAIQRRSPSKNWHQAC